MSAAHQPNPVSVLDGKYALLRELGSGATGTVYEAENLIVGKKIAIKMMNAGAFAEQDSQARFVTEARAAARIAHANVVDIHDLGVTKQGVPYIVMELLRGETLESIIDTRTGFSAAEYHSPATRREFIDSAIIDIPRGYEIRFVDNQNERRVSNGIARALMQLLCGLDRLRACSIRNQQVAVSSNQI